MIHRRLSAAVAVRDALTGRPLPRGIIVELDGEPMRPEYREGGYIVFIDLPAGGHRLTLRAPGYVAESVDMQADGGGVRIVSMVPLAARAAARGGFEPGAAIAVAISREPEVKLGQDAPAGGGAEWRVHCRVAAALPGFPAEFLLVDGDGSERCTIERIQGGIGIFAAPFARAHKRGLRLLPCSVRIADGRGEIAVCIPETGYLFDESAKQLHEYSAP